MKKTDIAMLVLIAGISMLSAFLIADNNPALKVSPKGAQVFTKEKISDTVEKQSEDTFNSKAINPTVETVIGQSSS